MESQRMKLLIPLFAALIIAAPLSARPATLPVINRALSQSVEVRGDILLSAGDEVENPLNVDFCSGTVIAATGTVAIIATAKHCVSPSVEDEMFFQISITPTPKYVVFFDGTHANVIPGSE